MFIYNDDKTKNGVEGTIVSFSNSLPVVGASLEMIVD
jgi:hypothetical protein